jgi:hypothetical protein
MCSCKEVKTSYRSCADNTNNELVANTPELISRRRSITLFAGITVAAILPSGLAFAGSRARFALKKASSVNATNLFGRAPSGLEELNALISDDRAREGLFSALSETELERFRHHFRFVNNEYVTGYWGDIAKAGQFGDEGLVRFVEAKFSVDPDRFASKLHYFGTMNSCCNPRAHFNCSYENNC